MEYYSLTNFEYNSLTNSLHFFAKPVQDMRIISGRDEMIKQMVREIGVENASIKSWKIENFVSNYLSGSWDFDQGIDDWRIISEITVFFEEKLSELNILPYQRIPSWAEDITDPYNEQELWSQYELVMVANFYSIEDLEFAKQMLSYVESMRVGDESYESLVDKIGQDNADYLNELKFAIQENMVLYPVRCQSRFDGSLQLFIYLGKYSLAYYQSDMQIYENKPIQLPQQIVSLIPALKGTILQMDHRFHLQNN